MKNLSQVDENKDIATKEYIDNYPNATTSADGFMSSADKTKLNGINISSGTADPTGGSDGDIYLQYE